MSICFSADVMCDSVDNKGSICSQWIFGVTQYHNISGRRKAARAKAKKEGWIHKNGKDYCPNCAKKIN